MFEGSPKLTQSGSVGDTAANRWQLWIHEEEKRRTGYAIWVCHIHQPLI
jgi:hypothetical protein